MCNFFFFFRSITQGTPVHHIIPNANDKRQNMNYDYYKRSAPVTTSAQVAGFNSPFPPNRQPTSYPLEQQLSSRQIIINDYITSQQVLFPTNSISHTNDKFLVSRLRCWITVDAKSLAMVAEGLHFHFSRLAPQNSKHRITVLFYSIFI